MFSDFVCKGIILPESMQAETIQSFQSLGIDLAKLDFERMTVEEAEATGSCPAQIVYVESENEFLLKVRLTPFTKCRNALFYSRGRIK